MPPVYIRNPTLLRDVSLNSPGLTTRRWNWAERYSNCEVPRLPTQNSLTKAAFECLILSQSSEQLPHADILYLAWKGYDQRRRDYGSRHQFYMEDGHTSSNFLPFHSFLTTESPMIINEDMLQYQLYHKLPLMLHPKYPSFLCIWRLS